MDQVLLPSFAECQFSVKKEFLKELWISNVAKARRLKPVEKDAQRPMAKETNKKSQLWQY